MFTLPHPTRRARWHLRHTPTPVLAGTLQCEGERHTVSWRWGRLPVWVRKGVLLVALELVA